VIPNPDPHVTTIDLELGSIAGEVSWSLNLGRIDRLAVAGDDIIVAGRTDSNSELVIVRDVDPAAPVANEIDRVPLPWQATLLETAELDGDAGLEIVVAPMPVTAVAVYGLSDSPTDLTVVELDFEAIDIATGDHDGDGKDEIYALDPRDERIIQIPL